MKKIKLLFDFKNRIFLMLFLFSTFIYAQQSISGVVVDAETDEPLFGVTVLVEGTAKGVVSDFDGNFTITNMDPGDYNLKLSYTGYTSVSGPVTVGAGDASVNFFMQFSASELNEIIVTGTGAPIAKKQLGNSIGSITTAGLADLPINSVSDILQGREPGIVGLPSGGLTGEGTQIRIRGSASLSQLNEPIVIIDGIRVDRGGGFGGGFVGAGGGGSTSRLDDINPESIERIEILKGASAATLFGTEASNGVIQIFTKRGKTGAPKFDFKTTMGFINFPKGRIPDNTGYTSDATTAGVMSGVFGRTIQPYEMVSFNATEELFEQGLSNTANLNVSGGTDFITYFTSARYSYTDGPFGGKNRDGYLDGQKTLATDIDELAQFNLNLNINPNDKWSIRLNSGYTARYSSTPENNNNIYGTGSLAQMSKPEFVKPNNTTGTYAFASVDETLQIQTESRVNKYTGSAKINFYPVENVKLDLTFGVDYSSQLSSNLLPFGWNFDGISASRPDGALQVDTRNFLAKSSEFKVNINNEFGNFKSSLIIGGQYVGQKTRVLGSQGQQFPGPGFEIVSAAAVQNTFESVVEVINTGAFVQEQLGFKDYLFVTVGGRLDAHSAFGSEFQAAFYPKISLSYVPSDQDGWSNIGPISSLQLRGSYGWAGLQPGAFDAFTTYQALASGTGAGIAPNNLGNAELSPEISKELEFGFNAGLFNDKINVEFTYWDRVTEDALYARQFPISGGFRSTQLTNIGLLSANGIEFNINGNVIRRKDLTVNLYFNAAYLQEKVEDLGGSPPLKVGGSYPRYRNYLIEGAAPGANYGAKLIDVPAGSLPVDIANSDGLPDTVAQLTTFLGNSANGPFSVPTSIGTGKVLLADDDGDGDLLDHFLGKSTPDWTGAFGGSVNYKQWTLSTTFEYKGGNFVVNNLTDAFRQANGAIGRNLPRSANVIRNYDTGGVDSSFTPIGDGAIRVAALDEWLNNTLALSPFSGLNTMEKADFIRWRELSLNYKIQGPILDMLNFETASVGVSGRNIAIFTEFTGVDPELNFAGRGGSSGVDQNFGQGISAFGWPIPTQVLFTLKFGF